MKKILKLIITWASLAFALAPSAFAQTTDGSVLYSPNVDLTTLSQNSFVGTVGGIFLTSYSYYPQVNYVGYADPTGAPLANSHLITLWDNSTEQVIASATVPAGNAAPLVNGYRWVQLPSTVTLNYGSYYVIGAQTDGVDLWGDLIYNNSPDNGNNGQITWNSQYVQLGSGWEFTRAGRYDSASDYPNELAYQTSAQDSIYPVANLGYNVVISPPATQLSVTRSGTTTTISFPTTSGATYTLYYTNTSGLSQPTSTWPSLPGTISGNGATSSFMDTTTDSNRVYRVGAH